jgi:succinoglycan biosynthesis protein ExoM
MDPVPVVAVCTPTYRRPAGLARLGDSLAALEVPPQVSVSWLVVNNDADEVIELSSSIAGTMPTVVENEPTKGIAAARNRAVQWCRAHGVDWIVWLDDDELPESNWLVEAFRTQETTSADVVAGPCHPRFEGEPPSWCRAGRFFERDRFEHNQVFPFNHARTSGILVRTSMIPPGPEPFDLRLNEAGGSDRVCFTEMDRCGARFVWCDLAWVTEVIPQSRLTVRWLLRRSYRIGTTRSLALVYLDRPSTPRRIRRALGGVARIGSGIVLLVRGVPEGRVGVIRGLRRVALGAGLITGVFGLRYQEYRTTHGA